ncbi:hypothetical protein [Jannaschia sp. W003]|uniref:hypothetical protein n=1 Tax=Jannaschia sp. W003 TaxID=2867012 RepID=UPI0021A7B24B|nr:hypothetical protein [Jannaschia sp. W003]UWQ20680.1 hypothetical protein K3554_11900 [Jannaschia sp. W003]
MGRAGLAHRAPDLLRGLRGTLAAASASLALLLGTATPTLAEGFSERCTAATVCSLEGCAAEALEFAMETILPPEVEGEDADGAEGGAEARFVHWEGTKLPVLSTDLSARLWVSEDGAESFALSYIFNATLEPLDYAEFALMRTPLAGRMGDVRVHYGICEPA